LHASYLGDGFRKENKQEMMTPPNIALMRFFSDPEI
jgi:hypothetical protein